MKTAVHSSVSISPERAARLYRLLRIIERQGLTRGMLLRKLRVGMRTFYRDLDILRTWGIEVVLNGRKYELQTPNWLSHLRFPDPELSFAEAIQLAEAKLPAARKLEALLGNMREGA